MSCFPGLARAFTGILISFFVLPHANLMADEASGGSSPASLSVNVDWATTVGKTTLASYGINGFTAFDPANSANASYQNNLAYLGVGLIRLHSWEMMGDSKTAKSGWLDLQNKTWDATKIQAALAPFQGTKASILINIPGFPTWLKTENEILDESEIKNYAAFCAELVRIVNIQNKYHVKYWEITNERDDAYWIHPLQNKGTVRVAALAEIYNECSQAMKAVDPSIQTGGPAAARPDYLPQMAEFVKDVLPNLDFFSVHAYASGSASDSDLTIFEKAQGFGDRVADVRKMLDEQSPARHIPLHLNEYNISWTWQTNDERMKNYKGAIFDAVALTSMANAGAEATCAWNERDGVYGKMDGDYNLRPSANVFHLLNTYGVGNIISTSVGNQDRVKAFAVQNPQTGSRLLLLINESLADHLVSLTSAGWTGEADRYVLDKDGFRNDKTGLEALSSGFSLPGHSLLFLITSPAEVKK